MIIKDNYFKLFAFCIPVKGKERGAIYDLQKARIKFIPLQLIEILEVLEHKSVLELKAEFDAKDQNIFQEYIDFLIKEQLGFITKEPNVFPKMDLNWTTPERISNAIIEYTFDQYSIRKVLYQLDQLLCKHLEIRLPYTINRKGDIIGLIHQFKGKTFKGIDLILQFSEDLDIDFLKYIYALSNKIRGIVVVGAPYSKSLNKPNAIVFTTDEWLSNSYQPFPNNQYILSVEYFTEALVYNPYYNKKVCIDKYGAIKNCIYMEKEFGSVQKHLIEDIIKTEEFQTLWLANVDKIMELKNSELRYCIFPTTPLVYDNKSALYYQNPKFT